MVGCARRAGKAHRHRPLVRRLPQRARGMPGHDRARVPRAGRQALGQPLPADHDRRPGARRGRRWPMRSGSRPGPASSADPWAACAPWNGRSRTPTGWRRPIVVACGAAATGEQVGLYSTQIAAVTSDRHWRGGDYHGAPPGCGPHVGLGLARRMGQVSYRSEIELETRFGRSGSVGRAVRRRVLPRAPRRQARAALRRRDLRRPDRRNDVPGRRARARRRRAGATAGARSGHCGRHRQRQALPAAAAKGNGAVARCRAACRVQPVRARRLPDRVG